MQQLCNYYNILWGRFLNSYQLFCSCYYMNHLYFITIEDELHARHFQSACVRE